MIRKLKNIYNITNYSKRKLRNYIKEKLNISKNTKTNKLIKLMDANNEEELYNKIKEEYNKFINDKNKKIETEQKKIRKLKDYERRNKKIIDTKPLKKNFININKEKLLILIKLIKNSGEKYLIHIGDKTFTLTKDFIEKLISPDYDVIGEGSDAEVIQHIIDYRKFSIERVIKKEKYKYGGFFKYEHKLKGIDLTDLQIYEDFKPEYYKENCFIKSLMGQVSDEILTDCKFMIQGKNTTLRHIKLIAEKHNLRINVKCKNKEVKHYGNGDIIVNIALLDEHYFKLCKVPITSFAIKNYFNICHIDEWYKINRFTNNKYLKSDNSFIDSYKLVKLLLENKDTLLKEIVKSDELYETCYFENIKSIGNLNFNENNIMLNEYKEKINNDYTNVFFDFETKTNGVKHIPYLCCIKSNKIKKTFYGEECGLYMLRYLLKIFGDKANIKLIAHNITYDLKFIFDYIQGVQFIQRGNNIMSGSGIFFNFGKKINIKFQDSYSLITGKLSSFGNMFGFHTEKEFIPYELYNKETEKYIPLKKIKKYTDYQVKCNNIGQNINKNEFKVFYEKFIENCNKWDCIKNNKVDIIKYAEIYCEIDCEILEKGYNTFKDMIYKVCNLDVENFISLASIADSYMLKEGVYNDIYKLNGVVREFIQLCVVGGRTMCSENKKIHIKGKIDDFDAVSLYPSAMSRLQGYLKGKPKILKTTDYNIIKNYDGFFIECIVKKVGKLLKFPLLSYVNDQGIRIFSNDMVGKKVYIDKITYEDCVKFQNIEFEIIRGYYYDEGRNYKLKETIDFMFSERLRLKKEGNPLQNIFKLLMNSSYGKTILKPIDTDIKYYGTEEKYKNSLIANYTFVKEASKIGNKYCIKFIKPINDHFNNASCGVEVLSMSKRIMNEVMTLAQDNNINIYYQDTDSMHIDSDFINKLSEKYEEKYNKKLIGKNMGQFHTDFESQNLKGNIYAKESIFLGKKCYLDVLTDESGDIDYHIRMKGISGQSVKYHSFIDYKGDILELYKNLYEGKKYTFDLTCNKQKACFDVVNMNTIRTKKIFNREVVF
jgi:hypothetical protein